MTTIRAVCDCPTCPDRGLIIPAPQPRRCRVCGWLMRLIEAGAAEEERGREE